MREEKLNKTIRKRHLYLRGSDEALWNGEHGRDGENFVGTLIVARSDQHLGQLWIQRKLGHHGTQLGQLSVVVKRCNVEKCK